MVFASFDHDIEPLEQFLGDPVLPWFDRVFDGRELRILGYSRQRIPANWKLMQENIKDPYHPGLLHSWFVTFGLWRAVVLLPAALHAQPGEIREAVLAHELLHVSRRDWAWVLAEEAALGRAVAVVGDCG